MWLGVTRWEKGWVGHGGVEREKGGGVFVRNSPFMQSRARTEEAEDVRGREVVGEEDGLRACAPDHLGQPRDGAGGAHEVALLACF